MLVCSKGQSMFNIWAAAIISSQRPFSCILLYISTLRVIYFNLGCQELFCCILFVYFLLESELFQCREPISLLFTGSHFWETLTVLEKPQTSWWPKLYFFFTVLTNQKLLELQEENKNCVPWRFSDWDEKSFHRRLDRNGSRLAACSEKWTMKHQTMCKRLCKILCKVLCKMLCKMKTGYKQAADGKLITPSLQRFSGVHWSWTAATKKQPILKHNSLSDPSPIILSTIATDSLTHSLSQSSLACLIDMALWGWLLHSASQESF